MWIRTRSFVGLRRQFIDLAAEFFEFRKRPVQICLARNLIDLGIGVTRSDVPDREHRKRGDLLAQFRFMPSDEAAKQFNVVRLWWFDAPCDQNANPDITVCSFKPFQGNLPLPWISPFHFGHRPPRRVSLRSNAASRRYRCDRQNDFAGTE